MNKLFISILITSIFIFNFIIKLNANDDTYINSSNITYNEKENIVELAEKSKINYKGLNILIDKGTIDYNKDNFEVFGNFYLYEELTILSGEDLKGNTSLDRFTANNVSYLYNDDLKIDSDNLKKENNLIYFYNNFLTPCEIEGYFNCPTWSLRVDQTKYDIKKDQFFHYDTFLQIADYKIFYLPYFSHYGSKAPRGKGFLTPTLKFSIGGKNSIITPYYYPINTSSDLTIQPNFEIDSDFSSVNISKINGNYEKINSSGNLSFGLSTQRNKQNDDISYSANISQNSVLSKNSRLELKASFTNSISTTRSENSSPITFEDIYINLINYDVLRKNDYIINKISTIQAFDTTNASLIPFSPSITYLNHIALNEKISSINKFNFAILKRNESNNNLSSENFSFKINNQVISTYINNNFHSYNKLSIRNNINSYKFEHDENLNKNSALSSLILSSDVFFRNFNDFLKPRLKFIISDNIYKKGHTFNEDSKAITFNYENNFIDNRIFGTDVIDKSRVVYGIESNFQLKKNTNFDFKINQVYDFYKNNFYTNSINQNSNFSDIAMSSKISNLSSSLNIGARINKNNLQHKELDISLRFKKPIDIGIRYNETSKEAFINNSEDTKRLNYSLGKKLNENLSLSFGSEIDLKNNFSPFKHSFTLVLFDECSKLQINYENTRFNDNFNTTPNETISINFYMDYLGFFGYSQKTDLFFK